MMTYEGNPKHKEPWQTGRRGSLCPRSIDARMAQQLLEESVPVGAARYAIWQSQPFCAREHRQGFWHGYPVSWREVPPEVRRDWQQKGLVRQSQIKRNW